MATGDGGELNSSVFGTDASDPNNSLLKKVTKRVSGLFPSSLTKWFGPSDGQQSVVRRRESIDDDDTTHLQQPPKKRAKPSSDGDYSPSDSFTTITSTPLLNSRGDHRHLQPGPSGYTRHSALSATTTSVNYASTSAQSEVTVANGDDKSDSGDSTSGYSSVQPQPHKESSFISDRGNALGQPSTSKTSPIKSLNASMNSSRSLFSEQSLNPQRQCMSARRPSFSASTFGSPSFVDRTLSTKRAVNSPFYGGRTMYGGASAYRRNRIIFPRDETKNVVKNSVDIKPANEASSSNDSVNLSKTARRILDTLEHFSTPVLDAKKIPNINRQSCDPNKSVNRTRAPYLRENKSVPNKELLVPTVPDLIKMKLKERLQDSTVQVRKVATSSKSILNTEYSIRTVEESSKPQKHVSKMKTKVVSVRGRKEDVDDTVDAVKLPEVKLPITNLPKFDFTLPPPATVVTKPTPTDTKKPASSSPTSKPIESLKTFSAQYNFAKPIIVSQKPKSATSINNFTFSEPINAKSSASISTNSSSPTFTFKASNSTAPRRKETAKNNGQNSVGFSLQPPSQFVSGSVMDILGKTEKKSESDNLMDKFKPAAGTWECSACMVRNIPSATRCLACETLKIKETPKKVEEQSYGFGNKFKMSSDKWECSACMVRNNSTDTKCVACTTPKPGATPTALPSAPAASTSNSFSGFGDKFKPASDTWECTACMVRNKIDAAKCIACETPKPGTKSEAKSSLIMPVAVKTNNSGFGELIKKQQSNWECPSCMVRNSAEKKTCACCEAPKPGEQQEFKFGTQASSGPQFKFGINNSTSSTGFKIDADKSAAPTTTFSFGVKPVDKPTDVKTTTNNGPAPVPTGFTFGVPSATKPETKTESPAKSESPSLPSANKPITFGKPSVPATDVNKSATFKYDSPVSTSSTIMFGSATSTINSGYSFPVPSSMTHTTPSKPTFSFGGASTTATSMSSPVLVSSIASIKPHTSTNIFGNATTSALTTQTSTISFGANTVTAVSTTPIATTTSSTSSSSAFSFKAPTNAKPVTFGSDNKIPVPQFNFGAGGLPFNPVYPTPKPATATTSTPAVNFGSNTTAFSNANTKSANKTEPPAFGTPSNQATFFNAETNVTNNNKSEVKPFSFSGTGEPVAKAPAFSFSQNDAPTAAPLAKAPIFNFGASASNTSNGATGTAAPAANMFSFNPNKSEKSITFGTGTSTVFGESAQPTTTPQNGGFNFGANSVPLNFNFGGGNNPPAAPTPAMFGFGSSQAGSGSVAAAPAPAPAASAAGIFTFGGGAPAQQPTPTFSPDIKPNFNFTGGSLPTFSAQSAPSAGAMPQRKIRKAVRRTQPR